MGFISAVKKGVRRAGKTVASATKHVTDFTKGLFEDPAAEAAKRQASFQRDEATIAAEQIAKDTVTQANLFTEQANQQLGSAVAMLGKAGALGLSPSAGAGPTGIAVGEGEDTSGRANIHSIFEGLDEGPVLGGGADFASGMSLSNISTFRDQLARDRMSLVESGQRDALTQMRNRDMYESERAAAKRAANIGFAKNVIGTAITVATMAATGGMSAANAAAAKAAGSSAGLAASPWKAGLLGGFTGNVQRFGVSDKW